jgi:hypothetical protein
MGEWQSGLLIMLVGASVGCLFQELDDVLHELTTREKT